ncbi:AAC(3) family N-acetyltransferase [Anabaena subtropica]|uniref:Aminoglycoside N(3)-acetyltransferase n=1 Tax=Anabaena subtropica FACHB-260 TaxID=2692884 RepID=A0ABR8CV62_9NOST|nr:AAC(3) family N-acetyltransferase [Anabaena subtropica]MBD2347080.1 AAC(3) family N-acetyltransferase [Anabaena subtropica FACHB-260]
MSEAKVIVSTPSPRTRQSLATDLFNAGINSNMAVIVHSSLSSLGWVCGGSVAVVQALMDVITPSGTSQVQISTVGSAQTKLFNMRNAVDFAITWLRDNPRYQEEVL